MHNERIHRKFLLKIYIRYIPIHNYPTINHTTAPTNSTVEILSNVARKPRFLYYSEGSSLNNVLYLEISRFTVGRVKAFQSRPAYDESVHDSARKKGAEEQRATNDRAANQNAVKRYKYKVEKQGIAGRKWKEHTVGDQRCDAPDYGFLFCVPVEGDNKRKVWRGDDRRRSPKNGEKAWKKKGMEENRGNNVVQLFYNSVQERDQLETQLGSLCYRRHRCLFEDLDRLSMSPLFVSFVKYECPEGG